MTLKTGTRIEFNANALHGAETAVIMRKSKAMGNIPAGFHPVRFASDGARLLAHESSFRVISNQ